MSAVVCDCADEMGDALPAVNLGTGRHAIQIAAGGQHTCAILDNNDLKCWGQGGDGRLGYAPAGSAGSAPSTNAAGYGQGSVGDLGDGAGEMGDDLPAVNLGSGRHAVYIVAGGAHTCAILDNADLKCWGKGDHGRLGLGDVVNRGDGG